MLDEKKKAVDNMKQQSEKVVEIVRQ